MGGQCFGKSEEDGHNSQLCHEEHGRDVLLPRTCSGRRFMEVLPGDFILLHMKMVLEM